MKTSSSNVRRLRALRRRADCRDRVEGFREPFFARTVLIRICGAFFLLPWLLSAALWAQTTGSSTQSGTGSVDATAVPAAGSGQASGSADKTDFHLELGAFYSPFVPGSGSLNWRGGDFRLTYTGIKHIAPFVGLAGIGNGFGSQLAYGVGSYVTVNRHFYAIWGISAAQETEQQFSPHRRYDLAGMFAVPKVKGMVFSLGWTEMPAYRTSGGGRIFALGDIYYWRKFIFAGNVNLNFARPGNEHSVSGQFSTSYGMQGHYYVAGGMSGGGAAYMLITGAPFEVRYQTVGVFAIVTKWFARHAGINCRYDYQRIIDSDSQRHAIRTGFFFEF
jgi:YaiO family outer membrane protein